MEEEKLIKFINLSGLNSYESKIYFSLLKYGAVTKSEIYKIAQIPQSRVYDILNSLFNKELIRQADQLIIPQHPRTIINTKHYHHHREKVLLAKKDIEEQFEEIKKNVEVINEQKTIYQELERMYDSPSTQHPIINRFLGVFKEAKDEILCCTTLPILYPSGQFYEEVLKAISRGINYRRVLGGDYVLAQGEKSIIADMEKNIKIKVLPEVEIKEKYYIVDDSDIFLRAIKSNLNLENEEAFIFTQREIIEAYKSNFEKLWKKAENLEPFLKNIKSKILLDKENSDILLKIFEGGRTRKESLAEEFNEHKVNILLKKGLIKNSEINGSLIINAEKFSG